MLIFYNLGKGMGKWGDDSGGMRDTTVDVVVVVAAAAASVVDSNKQNIHTFLDHQTPPHMYIIHTTFPTRPPTKYPQHTHKTPTPHPQNTTPHPQHRYLADEHDPTTVSLLLGTAASKAGTGDPTLTKMLYLHVPGRHPVGYPDFEMSSLVQAAALMGLGLLYRDSCNR